MSIIMEDGRPDPNPLRYIAEELASHGYVTDGGKVYEAQQVKDLVLDGLAQSAVVVFGLPRDKKTLKRVRQAFVDALKRKCSFSSSTARDPFVHGRLEWWKLRKVGRKPSSSRYDKLSR